MFKLKGYRLRVQHGDYVYVLPDRGQDIARRNAKGSVERNAILRTIREAWENNTAFPVAVGFTSRIRGFVKLDLYGEMLSVHDSEIIRL